jgi:putative cardiolipin synthase
VQYFIWSTDNIGILASETLLRAAERGVKVRVIVDDFLINADNDALVALNAHPNISIKIYNPAHSVGTSTMKRLFNVVTDFRGVNQRMHDKTAIFDKTVGVTGGRNMADEYFDYDTEYNFRDRDIVLMGKAVKDMTVNFDEFWHSPLCKSVDELLSKMDRRMSTTDITRIYDELHDYAKREENFESRVRQLIADIPDYFPKLAQAMVWDYVQFISDKPGGNENWFYLNGGGETTRLLIEQVSNAKESVLIQSPYLVVPKGGIKLFKQLVKRGVSVNIITNSLTSTDNLMAFSGYHKQRDKLLKAGVEIFEFKPHPTIQAELIERYPQLKDKNPIFALHAKSMVIDGATIYIGTFNVDPRSANLNTEVGVLINNKVLAWQLETTIKQDMATSNSWAISEDENPDKEAPFSKRLKLHGYKLLPTKSIL